MRQQFIEEFIKLERLAVVGASRNPRKYGAIVYRDMKSRGYDVVPVNPSIDAFDGDTAYPSLQAIPDPVEGAVFIIPPPKVPQGLRDAAAAGIKYVWLQPGAQSSEVLAVAAELGLNLVYNACVMVEAPYARTETA